MRDVADALADAHLPTDLADATTAVLQRWTQDKDIILPLHEILKPATQPVGPPDAPQHGTPSGDALAHRCRISAPGSATVHAKRTTKDRDRSCDPYPPATCRRLARLMV